MTPLRILIADDNEMFQDLMTLFLRGQQGVEIVGIARNGEEAINAVEEQQPDIVFIDLNMPNPGAVKAPRVIKKRYPRTSVYICSAFPDEALRASVEQLEVDGFVSKAELKKGLTNVVKRERERKK